MKNLFFKSLSIKKWAIIASSIAAIIVLSFVVYEATNKRVALILNGQEQVIKTHTSTVQELFDELEITVHSKDYIQPSLNSKVKDNSKIVWSPAKQVQLESDNQKRFVWTTAVTVEDLLEEQNVALNEYDRVYPESRTTLEKGMDVMVNRAFPVTLFDGGTEKKVWSTSTTVAGFLTQQGVTLTELDRVEPMLEEKVMENNVINVVRVEKVIDVVEEPIGYAIVAQRDENLPSGIEKIITDGKEGLVSREYEIIKENGIEIGRNLKSEQMIRDKQDKVVAVGTKAQPIQVASRGENEPGREMYVVATAYTASCSGCSGITKTGINLHVNSTAKVVAVDPNVIPLGSKVYVDGYGYALAADTGGAIKGNKIDVFIASKAEAYRWGRRTVKIKVLE
nr:G5 and 3D domain-containing protein [uncultured Bacillus sp.]